MVRIIFQKIFHVFGHNFFLRGQILMKLVQNEDKTYSLRHAKREVWENSVAGERPLNRFSKFCARSSFVRSLDVFQWKIDFAIAKASGDGMLYMNSCRSHGSTKPTRRRYPESWKIQFDRWITGQILMNAAKCSIDLRLRMRTGVLIRVQRNSACMKRI